MIDNTKREKSSLGRFEIIAEAYIYGTEKQREIILSFLDEKEKKTRSPYTITYKKKTSFWFVIGCMAFFVLLCLVIYFVVSSINKAPTRVDELMPYGGREYIYEFTY